MTWNMTHISKEQAEKIQMATEGKLWIVQGDPDEEQKINAVLLLNGATYDGEPVIMYAPDFPLDEIIG